METRMEIKLETTDFYARPGYLPTMTEMIPRFQCFLETQAVQGHYRMPRI